jgi:hypothetical protein
MTTREAGSFRNFHGRAVVFTAPHSAIPCGPGQGRLGDSCRTKALMSKPRAMDIVRRAYELWEQAGKPEGKDWDFYLQAERELQEKASKDAEEKNP